MASIINDPNGLKRIQFVGGDGTRKAIQLGKVDRKNAEAFRMRVEKIIAAAKVDGAPDDETSRGSHLATIRCMRGWQPWD